MHWSSAGKDSYTEPDSWITNKSKKSIAAITDLASTNSLGGGRRGLRFRHHPRRQKTKNQDKEGHEQRRFTKFDTERDFDARAKNLKRVTSPRKRMQWETMREKDPTQQDSGQSQRQAQKLWPEVPGSWVRLQGSHPQKSKIPRENYNRTARDKKIHMDTLSNMYVQKFGRVTEHWKIVR